MIMWIPVCGLAYVDSLSINDTASLLRLPRTMMDFVDSTS
jgi:hypothetical protein